MEKLGLADRVDAPAYLACEYSLADLLKRPEFCYADVANSHGTANRNPQKHSFAPSVNQNAEDSRTVMKSTVPTRYKY